MKFSASETIPAPLDAVQSALINPEYYASLGSTAGSLEAPELLEVTVEGGTAELRVRYAFSGTISGPARMAVDASKLTWVIHTTLDLSTHRATIEVLPDHYDQMLSCSGEMHLAEEDGTTIETVAGVLEVHLPLIGGKAETAILGGFTRHLELEAAALAAFCAARLDR